MPSTKESWDRVGESWRDVGRHVQERYKKVGEERARARDQERAKLDEPPAPSDPLGETVRSFKEFVKDPEIKRSLDQAVRATGAAISTTVDEAAEEIRRFFPTRGADEAPTPTGSASPTGSATPTSSDGEDAPPHSA